MIKARFFSVMVVLIGLVFLSIQSTTTVVQAQQSSNCDSANMDIFIPVEGSASGSYSAAGNFGAGDAISMFGGPIKKAAKDDCIKKGSQAVAGQRNSCAVLCQTWSTSQETCKPKPLKFKGKCEDATCSATVHHGEHSIHHGEVVETTNGIISCKSKGYFTVSCRCVAVPTAH